MTKVAVLLISHDTVGPVMAGPGIRYYHLARVLASHADVTLAIPKTSPGSLDKPPFSVVHYDPTSWETLAPHAANAMICVLPSDIAFLFPQLSDIDAYTVIDGYDPLLAEWLALNGNRDPDQLSAEWRERLVQLLRQFMLGDFFICASERQRDWWIGRLESNGRINPATYQDDPSLRKLVDVVAYGLPDIPPVHSRPVVKGVWKGIDKADKLILWGGGLWSWLDPITAIRAVKLVVQQRDDVRLIFPGTRHPNPALNALPSHNVHARALAEESGLIDKAIFFGDWIPYSDWQSLLLESDVALTLHHDTLETRLAFRSRVLEYIWAKLPIVATEGDAASEMVQHYSLGRVVHYNDVEGTASAIMDMLENAPDRDTAGYEAASDELGWQRVAEPLIAFCREPWHAADKGKSVYNPGMGSQGQLDRDYWYDLAKGYESGRYIRAMKWIDQQKRRFQANVNPVDPD